MRFSALNYVTIVCHSRSHDPKPPQSREGSGDDSKILRTLPKCVTQTPVYSEMDTGTTRQERTFRQKATKIVYQSVYKTYILQPFVGENLLHFLQHSCTFQNTLEYRSSLLLESTCDLHQRVLRLRYQPNFRISRKSYAFFNHITLVADSASQSSNIIKVRFGYMTVASRDKQKNCGCEDDGKRKCCRYSYCQTLLREILTNFKKQKMLESIECMQQSDNQKILSPSR